jgi:hypothetical protein
MLTDQHAHATDALARRLHELGYSFGEFSAAGTAGQWWSVHAHKGDRQILVHAKTLTDAYRAALEEATAGGFHILPSMSRAAGAAG